uniref:Uncharacterized protein n=1 Tax=Timema bartmani TaxID=61472 RepID=A0A7R9I0G9_9NEOP|nr:unnamed protein product [Timema bartmani]
MARLCRVYLFFVHSLTQFERSIFLTFLFIIKFDSEKCMRDTDPDLATGSQVELRRHQRFASINSKRHKFVTNRPRGKVISAPGYEPRGSGFDSRMVPWIERWEIAPIPPFQFWICQWGVPYYAHLNEQYYAHFGKRS